MLAGTQSICSPKCGDGKLIAEREECDDGNTNDDDGCTNTCRRASVSSCLTNNQCSLTGTIKSNAAFMCYDTTGNCACKEGYKGSYCSKCGNGVVEMGEECDDPSSEFCSKTCRSMSSTYCMDSSPCEIEKKRHVMS